MEEGVLVVNKTYDSNKNSLDTIEENYELTLKEVSILKACNITLEGEVLLEQLPNYARVHRGNSNTNNLRVEHIAVGAKNKELINELGGIYQKTGNMNVLLKIFDYSIPSLVYIRKQQKDYRKNSYTIYDLLMQYYQKLPNIVIKYDRTRKASLLTYIITSWKNFLVDVLVRRGNRDIPSGVGIELDMTDTDSGNKHMSSIETAFMYSVLKLQKERFYNEGVLSTEEKYIFKEYKETLLKKFKEISSPKMSKIAEIFLHSNIDKSAMVTKGYATKVQMHRITKKMYEIHKNMEKRDLYN